MPVSFHSFVFSACAAALLGLSGCGDSRKPAASATPKAAPKPAVAPAMEARYECPMGCVGSQSTRPGKCPVCEMALVKKA